MMEAVRMTQEGIILFDADILPKADDASFVPQAWAAAQPVTGTFKTAGRGNTMFVGDGEQHFVLRRYMRGGLVGQIVRDRYLWSGADKSRAFLEWRLLAKLRELGLPVPDPAAARLRRSGLFYQAELLTVRVRGIRSLSDRISAGPADAAFWRDFGAGIFQFHKAGVFHPDLNVSNCQFDREDRFWLLDFDRGKFLPPGTWRQRNLARLHRSLRKLKRFNPRIHCSNENWNQLLEGYFSASRSA
jgi:3-deoxy-D-manno-octulosonic acid kinase